MLMSKIILGLVLILAVTGIASIGYGLSKKSAPVPTPSPKPQVVTTPTSIASPSATPDIPSAPRERPTAGFVNPSATIAKINEAFSKKTGKDLGGDLGAWMTDQVNVILYATECCGPKTSKEAASQLNAFAISGIDPWNCSDTNPLIPKILAKDAQNFKDMTLCISSNELVAGFHLDNEFLIDRIILSGTITK